MNSNIFSTSAPGFGLDPNSFSGQVMARQLAALSNGTAGLTPQVSSDPFMTMGQGMSVGAAPQSQTLWNWNPQAGFGTNVMNNIPTINAGVQGVQALYGIYSGLRGLSLARDQFDFTRNAYNTNLRNSTQSYNTALEDRIRGRTSDYAGKEADVQAYLSRNSLKGGG